MARIRSVHPGQWTDEAFVSVSMAARLLAIALRNEADDNGIFEWKPLQIKMRLFPADAVDVDSLLQELADSGQVMEGEIKGRKYGAIRNFTKYQRPKKPNPVHPISNDFRTFVGLTDGGGEVVPHQLPTGSEEAAQMEEEGGNSNTYGARFDEFWSLFPDRDGPNPKKPARQKFENAVKRGVDPECIIRGAKMYALHCKAKNSVGTSYVAQAQTWLNQERWNDSLSIASEGKPLKPDQQQVFIECGTPEWAAWRAYDDTLQAINSQGRKGKWLPSRMPPSERRVA